MRHLHALIVIAAVQAGCGRPAADASFVWCQYCVGAEMTGSGDVMHVQIRIVETGRILDPFGNSNQPWLDVSQESWAMIETTHPTPGVTWPELIRLDYDASAGTLSTAVGQKRDLFVAKTAAQNQTAKSVWVRDQSQGSGPLNASELAEFERIWRWQNRNAPGVNPARTDDDRGGGD